MLYWDKEVVPPLLKLLHSAVAAKWLVPVVVLKPEPAWVDSTDIIRGFIPSDLILVSLADVTVDAPGVSFCLRLHSRISSSFLTCFTKHLHKSDRYKDFAVQFSSVFFIQFLNNSLIEIRGIEEKYMLCNTSYYIALQRKFKIRS